MWCLTSRVPPACHPAVVPSLWGALFPRETRVAHVLAGPHLCAGPDERDVVVELAQSRVKEALVAVDVAHGYRALAGLHPP